MNIDQNSDTQRRNVFNKRVSFARHWDSLIICPRLDVNLPSTCTYIYIKKIGPLVIYYLMSSVNTC